MSWKVVLAVGILTLTVCSQTNQAATRDPARGQDIDTILNSPSSPAKERNSVDCLFHSAYRRFEVLDDRHLAFYGPGHKIWINQLSHRCNRLRPKLYVLFEPHLVWLCKLDTFSGMFPGSPHPDAIGCSLGPFEPIDRNQLKALKTAFKQARLEEKRDKKRTRKRKRALTQAKIATVKQSE